MVNDLKKYNQPEKEVPKPRYQNLKYYIIIHIFNLFKNKKILQVVSYL